MVAKALRWIMNRVTVPSYRLRDETFWQAQCRQPFRSHRVGKQRPEAARRVAFLRHLGSSLKCLGLHVRHSAHKGCLAVS